jgi:hypothetical protein
MLASLFCVIACQISFVLFFSQKKRILYLSLFGGRKSVGLPAKPVCVQPNLKIKFQPSAFPVFRPPVLAPKPVSESLLVTEYKKIGVINETAR